MDPLRVELFAKAALDGLDISGEGFFFTATRKTHQIPIQR